MYATVDTTNHHPYFTTGYAAAILVGLQRGHHIYAGTVPEDTIARRRARNKAARIARRNNRRRP